MFGWRGRLGLPLTSSDQVSESEFNRHTLDDVAVHASQMRLEDGVTDEATRERMSEDTERCVEFLATADVDTISNVCTTGRLAKGQGFEAEFEQRMGRRACESVDICWHSVYINRFHCRTYDDGPCGES